MLNNILFNIGELVTNVLTEIAEFVVPAVFIVAMILFTNPILLVLAIIVFICVGVYLIRRYLRKQKIKNNEYKVGLVDGVKLMKKIVILLMVCLIIFSIAFFVILYYERTKLGLPLLN